MLVFLFSCLLLRHTYGHTAVQVKRRIGGTCVKIVSRLIKYKFKVAAFFLLPDTFRKLTVFPEVDFLTVKNTGPK